MTQDQIIELAKQAGFLIDEAPISQPYVIQATRYKIDDELQRFAELVRNHALEEAAKVCRKEAERALFNWKHDLPANQPFWNGAEQMAAGCANDIASRKALK